MSTYTYRNNNEGYIDTIEGITFHPGEGIDYTTDQYALNKYLPHRLDRYIDGVLSNDNAIIPEQRKLAQEIARYSGFNTPETLAKGAIPIAIPAGDGAAVGLKFTNTSGAFSLTTTVFPTTYSNIYLYMPIGAFDGTNPTTAGLYYATMSSSSVGQLYLATYTSGIPSIPVTLVKPVTTLNKWLSQTLNTDITLATVTVPANKMGLNGELRTKSLFTLKTSAYAKVTKTFFDTANLSSNSNTTNISVADSVNMHNRGNLTEQVSRTAAGVAEDFQGTSNVTWSAINTAVDKNVTFTGKLLVTSGNVDHIILEAFTVEVLPS